MAETGANATPPPGAGCCCRPDAASFHPKTRFRRLVAAIRKFTLRRRGLLTAVRKRRDYGTQPQTPAPTHQEADAPEKPTRLGLEVEQSPPEEHAADADAAAAAAGTQPPNPPPTSEEADARGKTTRREAEQPSLEEHAADANTAASAAAKAVAGKHRPHDCSLYEVDELKGADAPCSATLEEETPKKPKRRKKAKRAKHASDAPAAAIAGKYWAHRRSLFSLYDRGVRMDAEGWYSATPEAIAAAQAARASPTDLVVDAFAGVGGNSIQFATRGCYVLAVDIDPRKVELARHNARIYGVEDMIEFVVGDFFRLAPALKADLVFLSPPWGGPSYKKTPIYTLNMLKPKDGYTIFQAAQKIAPNIIMFLPLNVDIRQVKDLSWLCSPPLHFKVKNCSSQPLVAFFHKDFTAMILGRYPVQHSRSFRVKRTMCKADQKELPRILETWQEIDTKKSPLLCGIL